MKSRQTDWPGPYSYVKSSNVGNSEHAQIRGRNERLVAEQDRVKLVAVTEDGQTKFLPMAEPNWDQLWGTGLYWGRYKEGVVSHAPPKQSEIGVAKEVPVFVKTNPAALTPTILTILGALLAALVGAYVAQTHNDRLTRDRETERHTQERAEREFDIRLQAVDRVTAADGRLALSAQEMLLAMARGEPGQFEVARAKSNDFLSDVAAARQALAARVGPDDPMAEVAGKLMEAYNSVGERALKGEDLNDLVDLISEAADKSARELHRLLDSYRPARQLTA